MWRRQLLILCAMVLLANCALMDKTESFKVAGVRFENASYYPITNISLRVDSIEEAVFCKNLLVRNDCFTDFPVEEYFGNPIIITWEQNGKSWTTGQIVADMPMAMNKDESVTYAVILGNQGSYNTHFAR